jgi:hypothetical protein
MKTTLLINIMMKNTMEMIMKNIMDKKVKSGTIVNRKRQKTRMKKVRILLVLKIHKMVSFKVQINRSIIKIAKMRKLLSIMAKVKLLRKSTSSHQMKITDNYNGRTV